MNNHSVALRKHTWNNPVVFEFVSAQKGLFGEMRWGKNYHGISMSFTIDDDIIDLDSAIVTKKGETYKPRIVDLAILFQAAIPELKESGLPSQLEMVRNADWVVFNSMIIEEYGF